MGTKAENRKMYGVGGQAHKATRVLAHDLEHFQDKGIDGKALIVIDDTKGTFFAANSYDGKLGKNFSTDGQVHPLPAADSDRWKEWNKRGFRPANVADFPCLEQVEMPEAALA